SLEKMEIMRGQRPTQILFLSRVEQDPKYLGIDGVILRFPVLQTLDLRQPRANDRPDKIQRQYTGQQNCYRRYHLSICPVSASFQFATSVPGNRSTGFPPSGRR